jgi:glucokinase
MYKKTVMTLDAGGTNFVFSAISDGLEVATPVHLAANGHDLERCLKNMIAGFEAIQQQLERAPDAISFAFPGPADYENGIIGDLSNLPGFRSGVALGPMLEDHFGIPVFINNDGDLFAYGEAMHGLLPHVNAKLKEAGSSKQYHNLVGFTLGTGFGGGLVRNNQLIIGDNGAAGEVWLLRNPFNNNSFAEESISARAITGEYSVQSGLDVAGLMPFDVFQIAKAGKPGDRDAAMASFRKFGVALGMAMAEIITVMDGLVVIGGGLANAWELFAPAMFDELNGFLQDVKGNSVPRLVMKTYNLENDNSFLALARGEETRVKVPFSEREVTYDPMKRTGIGLSRLGTSKAVALGAYAFALNKLT